MATQKNKKRRTNNSEQTEKHDQPEQRHILFPLFIASLSLIAVGVIVTRLFALSPSFADKYYTQGVYPAIRKAVGFLPSLTKVSFTEVAALVLVLCAAVCIIVNILWIITKRFRFKRFITHLCVLLFIISILLNIFNLTGGINYYNTPLEKKLSLEVKPRTETQLYGLCVNLRSKACDLRKYVSTDSRGIFVLDDTDKYLKKAAQSVEEMEEINPKGSRVPPAKKMEYLVKFMRSCGVSGINMPFFAESNVNTEQSALLIPATAAHENAHYLGVAREDEANFVAYLACTNSEDVNMQYSGTVLALFYASERLFTVNESLYRELLNGYSNELAKDIDDYNTYWDSNGMFRKLSSSANDAYLKYNGSKDGEESYGAMVDLLLAHYEKQNAAKQSPAA